MCIRDSSGTANNTLYVGGIPAANIVSNTQLQGNLQYYVNTSSNYTLSGTISYSGNVIFNTTSAIKANGVYGTAGQVLTSNLTGGLYWNSPSVTSQGNGISISGGAISVNAQSGLVSNTNGLFLLANSGIVANAYGTFVNTAYIVTQNPVSYTHLTLPTKRIV